MQLIPFLLLVIQTYQVSIKAAFISGIGKGWSIQRKTQIYPIVLKSEIADADFERVCSNDDESEKASVSNENSSKLFESKSIIDMTIDDNNETFPFLDTQSQNAIFCRLAITSNLEDELGGTYAVGVPEDDGVLMIVERGENEMEYIDPDASENVEILEIMAGALHKYLSKDLQLQRTPRILTIAGDLNQYIEKLPDNLISEDMTVANLIEEPDGDLDKVDEFFKKQFGKEQYDEFIKEFEQNQFDSDFLKFAKLFEEGIEDSGGIRSSPEEFEQAVRNLGHDFQQDGVGIKLVGFTVKQDDHPKTPPSIYSLVKPFKPLTVVGRLRRNAADNSIIFELLSPDEEHIIVPKLEQICMEEMKKQGINFNSPNHCKLP